jgi:hypothetical protein
VKYMVQTWEPGFAQRAEYESFIGSPEHMRRMRHHQSALRDIVTARGLAGKAKFIVVSIGMGPPDEAVTLRQRSGNLAATDGPFAETKEALAGFDLIEFDSPGDALEFSKREHSPHDHVTVIRPLQELWWVYNTSAGGGAKIFMLTMFGHGDGASAPQHDRIALNVQRIGGEYSWQRGVVGGKSIVWSGGWLAPPSETAAYLTSASGSESAAEDPYAAARGFILIASESIDDAATWARKIAGAIDDAVEVRSINGFFWVSHD